MNKYIICPNCKGKGYTIESNIINEGLLLGLFSDIIDGFTRTPCRACHSTGRLKIKD